MPELDVAGNLNNMSAPSSSASRRRVVHHRTRACIACCSKKKKCEYQGDSCKHCTKLGLTCLPYPDKRLQKPDNKNTTYYTTTLQTSHSLALPRDTEISTHQERDKDPDQWSITPLKRDEYKVINADFASFASDNRPQAKVHWMIQPISGRKGCYTIHPFENADLSWTSTTDNQEIPLGLGQASTNTRLWDLELGTPSGIASVAARYSPLEGVGTNRHPTSKTHLSLGENKYCVVHDAVRVPKATPDGSSTFGLNPADLGQAVQSRLNRSLISEGRGHDHRPFVNALITELPKGDGSLLTRNGLVKICVDGTSRRPQLFSSILEPEGGEIHEIGVRPTPVLQEAYGSPLVNLIAPIFAKPTAHPLPVQVQPSEVGEQPSLAASTVFDAWPDFDTHSGVDSRERESAEDAELILSELMKVMERNVSENDVLGLQITMAEMKNHASVFGLPNPLQMGERNWSGQGRNMWNRAMK